jgi:D-serine deaminase-like pyridoxal phosphate-dependent protein
VQSGHPHVASKLALDHTAGRVHQPPQLVDHGLTVARLSEEHGVVEGPGVERLRVGDKVRILMNHVCPVVNLFPVMHLVRGGEVVEVLPVEGRGRLT